MDIIHEKDADCTVDPQTDCCSVCGVHHGDECPECNGRGFHVAGCSLIEPPAWPFVGSHRFTCPGCGAEVRDSHRRMKDGREVCGDCLDPAHQ
jgi:hypothetical protein